MNLSKIGKFIAECRKCKNLTQEQLADKLGITDRAVSKWERGLSLPDAGIMIELCNILNISVNELFNGERIDMKDYNKKTEELLIEMKKQEEIKNKKLMVNNGILLIASLLFYFGVILLAAFILEEGLLLGSIVSVSTFLLVIICFFVFKTDIDIGYYECKYCHHKFVPSYIAAMLGMHLPTKRYLKCPKCKKRVWSKKVMSK